MLYLLHAGALLAGCFLYYWLLLRNETHFTLNRWVLLGCLAGSLLLPLVTVPAGLSLRQALQAEAGDAEVAAIVANETTGATNVSSSLPPAGTIGVTATPAPDKQSIKEIAQTSAEASTPSSLSPSTLHSRNSSTPQPSPLLPANLPRLLWWIYLAGVTVFGVHFLLQLGFLVVKLLRHPGFDAGGFHLVELDEEAAPYSFWNRVFLNPNRYDPETFHQIVQHEAVHVRQRHSMDLMLAELLVVFQWFNPFAWLYRKAIENNLEFLTDAEVLRQGEDPVDYQLSLVKVAAPNYPLGLTTSYNQNLLEKRITMMKTKKSSLASGWKYLSILPLLLLSMLQFNAVAQAPAPPAAPVPAVQPTVVPAPAPVAAPSPAPGVVASPAYTPVPTPSFDNAVPVPAPNPMPNPMPMPMAVVPDVDLSNMEIPMPAPTVEPVLEVSDQDFAKARRSWTAEIEGNEVCFMFIVADDNRQHLSTNSRCFPLAEFGTLPRGQMGKFSLKRTSGTLDMNGVFDGNEGLGSFTFTPDPSFVQTLASEGYEYENLELLHFFFIDFTPGYLRYLRQQGYDPTERQLFKLAIFGFSEEDFKETQQEYRTAGYDKPGLKNMIELRIHGVDGDYIKELTSAGYDDLSLNDVKKARIHGLSAAFVNDMAQAGFRDLDFDDVIKMAIHGVSSEYVQELADLGYTGLRADEVVNARIHGVSTEGLASLKKAGFTDLSLKEARNARIHGVDAEYVNELADLGYENLDLDEVIKAKIHGVSKRKVGDLKKA
ncbi:MAG: M56 family metallopeptidase, partial [Bacteroidota bacterium]